MVFCYGFGFVKILVVVFEMAFVLKEITFIDNFVAEVEVGVSAE